MRRLSRTPIATADPVDVHELADHLRVEIVEAGSAMRFARAAADEIEHHAALALLTQEIVAETGDTPGKVVVLPIGPVQAGEPITVARVEDDGSTTEIITGWHSTFGRYPELHFDEAPDGPVRVTYEAGYGADETAVPRDLSLAILDQAMRLYDRRGDADETPGMAPSAARISARYRRVSVGA